MRPTLVILAALALVAPIYAQAPAHHHARHHHSSIHKAAAPASQGVKVWVNTNSGVYHYPGERWYGRTQEGQYMTEDAAKKAGYRATENGQ